MEPDWSQATCLQDPELWTGDYSDNVRYRNGMKARELCRSCPLRMPCLERAVKLKPSHGIWGGYSAQELWRLRSHGINTAFQLYVRPAPRIGRPHGDRTAGLLPSAGNERAIFRRVRRWQP